MLKGRRVLLRTVSVIALAGALASEPQIAMAEGPVWILEGRIGGSSGDEQPWATSFIFPNISTERIGPDVSYEGMIGYVAPNDVTLPIFGGGWDVGIFARYGATENETEGGLAYPFFNVIGGNYATYYTAGAVEHEEEHFIVDFEARKDVGLGSDISTVAKVGIRFAYLNAETDTQFVFLPSAFYTLNESRESEFYGVGPMIGFESSKALTENISFDLGGTASLLFGQRSLSVSASGGLPFLSNSIDQDDFDVVSMVEGRVGFTFSSPDTPATLGIGVEGRAWFDAFDQRTFVNILGPPFPGEENADRYDVGGYLRLTIPTGS